MDRTRSPKPARFATAAILALTLAASTPALAAGPFTDLGASLTSWVGTWLQSWLGTAPDDHDARAESLPSLTSGSSRSTEAGTPGPSATDGGAWAPCELVCTEAGPGGDPNG